MTIHLGGVRFVWGLALALLAIGLRDLGAQELKLYSEILPDGAASVGPDWAELVFPPLALSNTGCFRADSFPPQREPMRSYGWGAQTRFVDAFTGPTDHFTTLGVGFLLPARVPITDALLDSALAVADLRVMEYKGEPPSPSDIVTPRRAWARREGRRVRIRIEGKEAVAALLRPRADSIDLHWCRRQDTTYVFPRRTRIVGGSGIAPKVPHYTTADSAAAFAAAVDAMLAEDSSASSARPRDPFGFWPRDPEPTVFIRIGTMRIGAWAAPSVERLRNWRWRVLGLAVDSTTALTNRADNASRSSRAVPLEIVMSFYMPTDTVEVTEYRLFRTCGIRTGDSFPMWWVKRLLTSTSSGWKQVSSRNGVSQGACN